MLTSEALDFLRNDFMNNIAYAKYKAGDTFTTVQITNASILEDGRISISFLIDHVETDITVSEVQLFNEADVMLASKTESIALQAFSEGILYRFFIRINEQ